MFKNSDFTRNDISKQLSFYLSMLPPREAFSFYFEVEKVQKQLTAEYPELSKRVMENQAVAIAAKVRIKALFINGNEELGDVYSEIREIAKSEIGEEFIFYPRRITHDCE